MAQFIKNVDKRFADRKGASRRSDVPPDVLRALTEGRIESITLSEFLAIDLEQLWKNVFPTLGLKKELGEILHEYQSFQEEGIKRKFHGIGEILHRVLKNPSNRNRVILNLSKHSSDLIRAVAAYTLMADPSIPFKKRLRLVRPFATDRNMNVRETAWDSFRTYLIQDLEKGLPLLQEWVKDRDPNIRRCAVEGSRPRGVWATHINALKQNPEIGVSLLEPVKGDPSRYVQNAVGNWLNDASKLNPSWVQKLGRKWLTESPTPETQYIVNRGLRTIRKTKQDGARKPQPKKRGVKPGR